MPRLLAPVAGALFAVLLLASPAAAQDRRQDDRIPGRYVVSFAPGVSDVDRAVRNRERRDGFRARHRYRSALKGFSARLSAAQVRRLEADPKVATVMPDRRVRANATEALASGETAPTGVDRIEAVNGGNTAGPAGVAVAVIDTGIDSDHPDLAGTVLGGKNCIDSTKTPEDDHGHGTHVAGTVAALNNGTGVVGVAPGTKLLSVKVLDSRGSGSMSTVICGIDWVTANAASIGVANMSLGGLGDPIEPCSDTMKDLEHQAICRSTAAGVLYAVAAGNDGWDFDYQSNPNIPAAYPEVVTVAAASDTDGAPGGLGATCGGKWGDPDDTRAGFSNYAATSTGRTHTVAAPGGCILSTQLGGGTTTMSGTSMASPHAAGALALCLTAGSCQRGDAPATTIAHIDEAADGAFGFSGDPFTGSSSRYYGYLTRLAVPALTDGGTTDGGTTDGGTTDGETTDGGATVTLSASGYKVKGVQHADLTWSGATTTSVDVYRDGKKIATTANDGAHTDKIGNKGGGSYVYELCEAGSTTTCSGDVTVSF